MKVASMQATLNIADLAAEVQQRTAEHAECVALAAEANRRETASLNQLNQAQKQLDDAMKALRMAAPNRTDWGRQAAFIRCGEGGADG